MADQSLGVRVPLPARAQARYVRVTPMKARRMIDLIRGRQADEALAILRFSPQSASEPVYKVLASAVANARHTAERESRRLDVDDLVIREAYVDEGPTLKRFRPRAQGRAFRVRKRTSHITVIVAPRVDEVAEAAKKRFRRSGSDSAADATMKPTTAKKTTAKKATAKKATAKSAETVSKAPAKKAATKSTEKDVAAKTTEAKKPDEKARAETVVPKGSTS